MEESIEFDEWAIVELMGHVKMAGRLTEVELFGSKLARIDIPGPNDQFVTQYFGASSVYRITPTTEEIARAAAVRNQPVPIHRWELPPAPGDSGDIDNLTDDLTEAERW